MLSHASVPHLRGGGLLANYVKTVGLWRRSQWSDCVAGETDSAKGWAAMRKGNSGRKGKVKELGRLRRRPGKEWTLRKVSEAKGKQGLEYGCRWAGARAGRKAGNARQMKATESGPAPAGNGESVLAPLQGVIYQCRDQVQNDLKYAVAASASCLKNSAYSKMSSGVAGSSSSSNPSAKLAMMSGTWLS